MPWRRWPERGATGHLVRRLGAGQVAAYDPSPSFVSACRERHPGVDVRDGAAETLPFDDACFDVSLSQLVLHFVTDPAAAGAEMARVVRPGGTVAGCVWNFDEATQMLGAFWDAATSLDPDAPAERRVLRFGRPGELSQWLSDASLTSIRETTITVSTTYRDFEEVWAGFLAGIGPAGSYCMPSRGRAEKHCGWHCASASAKPPGRSPSQRAHWLPGASADQCDTLPGRVSPGGGLGRATHFRKACHVPVVNSVEAEARRVTHRLEVVRWSRYGKRRLYVNTPIGTPVGWVDLVTGERSLAVPDLAVAFEAAIAGHETAIPAAYQPRHALDQVQVSAAPRYAMEPLS